MPTVGTKIQHDPLIEVEEQNVIHGRIYQFLFSLK